jgi:ABC-2 type transport system permease protein
MTLTLLLLRRHRWFLTAWSVLLTALCGLTVTAYRDTYATPDQRRAAVAAAQGNGASTVMYGRLPGPGTPAQMFTWEIGAFATILVAVLAVLVAVRLTRATEDDGTLELLRGCGIEPGQPLRSALVVQAGLAAVLALGGAVGVGAYHGSTEGVTWPGALAFGAVLGLTFAFVGALTTVLAQVAPTAGTARGLGFAAVGVAVAVRAVADARRLEPLNWLSPLGLRATVEPFTANRWAGLAPAVLATVVLAGLAIALSGRREVGDGLIRRHDTRDGRLRVAGPLGLTARLARSTILAWTVSVAAIGTFFATIGAGTVDQGRGGDVGGFLGAQLGTDDPAAGYLAYCGTVVGILVSAFAVLSVLSARHAEHRGLTDQVLATGLRRWAPLAAQAVVTAVGCAVVLAVTGILTALVAPSVISGDGIATRGMAYVVGQWPATVAITGCAVLAVGVRPVLAWLAWLPLVTGAGLALLGDLLGVPRSVQELGFFRHVPDVGGADPDVGALLVLVALGAGLCALGVAGTTRRDIVVR